MAERKPPRVMGPGHDTFWDWCGKGELRLQSCQDCGHRPWPVVQACENCGSEKLEFEAVSGKGKLVSWCSFHQPYYGEVMPPPYDTIVVELEEGTYFLSNPKGFANSEASAGMDVKVAFISCEDENGAYSLPVFERA